MKIWILLLLILISPVVFAETYTLYFIRHAEKDLSTKTDPALTKQGMATAQRLKQFMSDKPLSIVYSSDYKRTRATAQPVADQKKLELNIYNPRELASLAKTLTTAKKNALIVGHSNTTPEIVALVGGRSKPITDEEYGEVFIVTINSESNTTETSYHQLN